MGSKNSKNVFADLNSLGQGRKNIKNQGKGSKMRNLFPRWLAKKGKNGRNRSEINWNSNEGILQNRKIREKNRWSQGEGTNQKEEGNIVVIWVGFSRPTKNCLCWYQSHEIEMQKRLECGEYYSIFYRKKTEKFQCATCSNKKEKRLVPKKLTINTRNRDTHTKKKKCLCSH